MKPLNKVLQNQRPRDVVSTKRKFDILGKSDKSIVVDAMKVKAINHWSIPNDRYELRNFFLRTVYIRPKIRRHCQALHGNNRREYLFEIMNPRKQLLYHQAGTVVTKFMESFYKYYMGDNSH